MSLRSGYDDISGASTGAAGAEHISNGTPVAHGGAIDLARERFPNAPEPWIDLSTGINPCCYPVPGIAAAAWARLPIASDYQALRLAASRRYGAADASMVVPAAGSQALIQSVPRLLEPSRVTVLSPTYKEHHRSWVRAGHDVAEVSCLEALANARVAVVVNPNNPTGRLVGRDDLIRLAFRLASTAGLLVVDEAFMDVLDGDSSLIPVRASRDGQRLAAARSGPQGSADLRVKRVRQPARPEEPSL